MKLQVSGRPPASPSLVPDVPAPNPSRRAILAVISSGILMEKSSRPSDAAVLVAGVKCPGLNGYALSRCLREARLAREAQEAAERPPEEEGSSPSTAGSSSYEDLREARLRNRQYEQPGTLQTLPSGIQYREIETGSGREALFGSTCEITYIVYRLSSGAYFKNSGGGTPILLFALGYGFEGQADDGEVYRFRLGDPLSLPRAATPAVVGMREGGRRRILIPPQLGWVSDEVGPRPISFGGQRRLVGHRQEPLLLEVVLSRVIP